MRKIVPLSLGLAAAILLSACAATPAAGPPAAGTPTAAVPTTASLAGSQWRFTAIDGAPPVAADAALEFQADRLGARVGCNGMGGSWRIEGGTLVAGPIVSTQMYCEGKMEQERAVGQLLDGKPTVTLTGDRLSLKSADHAAELVRK